MNRKIMVEVTKEEFEQLEKGLSSPIGSITTKDLINELIRRCENKTSVNDPFSIDAFTTRGSFALDKGNVFEFVFINRGIR